jgi:hypothetical protein
MGGTSMSFSFYFLSIFFARPNPFKKTKPSKSFQHYTSSRVIVFIPRNVPTFSIRPRKSLGVDLTTSWLSSSILGGFYAGGAMGRAV